jgi:hypothetical protein
MTMEFPLIASYPGAPTRLAPFLAQWDYVEGQLFSRLEGLGDEELLWEPASPSWTVKVNESGESRPTSSGGGFWAPTADAEPPRTLAWSLGHLGWTALVRADWLVGSHSMTSSPEWPRTAVGSVEFAQRGLSAWRDGLGQMDDDDLDVVGRSAFPDGLDPQLPLLDIVWWVNKELLWHSAEIWYLRDLFAVANS